MERKRSISLIYQWISLLTSGVQNVTYYVDENGCVVIIARNGKRVT